MKSLGFNPTKEEKETILSDFGEDTDSKEDIMITKANFIQVMSEKLSGKNEDEDILKAFRLFDHDVAGCITMDKLKKVAKELGESFTEEELTDMMSIADMEKKGFVTQDDFLRVVKTKI